MMASCVTAATFVYDYSTVPTASPFPGTAIDGQDNWVDVEGGPTVRNDLDVVPGIDGNDFYDNGLGIATRVNDQVFSYALTGSQLTMSYVGRENPAQVRHSLWPLTRFLRTSMERKELLTNRAK